MDVVQHQISFISCTSNKEGKQGRLGPPLSSSKLLRVPTPCFPCILHLIAPPLLLKLNFSLHLDRMRLIEGQATLVGRSQRTWTRRGRCARWTTNLKRTQRR